MDLLLNERHALHEMQELERRGRKYCIKRKVLTQVRRVTNEASRGAEKLMLVILHRIREMIATTMGE